MLSLLFMSSLYLSWGQSEEPYQKSETTQVRIIELKDMPLRTDSLTTYTVQVTNKESIFSKTSISHPVDSQMSESVINIEDKNTLLVDDPELSELDAQWMKLIRQSNLYDVYSFATDDIPLTDIDTPNITTDLFKKRLAEIDAKTPFHITYNPELERLVKIFVKNRKETFANLMDKARYYFPLFEEYLDKYDIPLEVKYLAIVESALRPRARSRMGATGLWQFMYATGKQYGLTMSSYVDERRDPMLATEAACKYLIDLYAIFDDWDLALAAYNSGPGNVSKAIRRSGGKRNYWNIRPFLPRETASYIPLFYATMYLFEYADAHQIKASVNFNLHHFEVDSVQVKKTLTFEQIQNTIGVDEDLLEFLNPSYKLNIIPYVSGKNYVLVLPREYIGLFIQNEDRIYAYAEAEEAKREKPLPKYIEMGNRIHYRVRRGDYLGKIAEKYGVSVNKIKRWNRLKTTRLSIGQRLVIYPRHL